MSFGRGMEAEQVVSAEDRIRDEAKAKIKRDLELEEVRFIARKLGWAVTCYPRIMAETFRVPLSGEFDVIRGDIKQLFQNLADFRKWAEGEFKKLNERLSNAGKLVGEIDKRTKHLNGVKR